MNDALGQKNGNAKYKCSDIIDILETLSPKAYALSWDNVGLLVGRKNAGICKILITLDVNKAVIKKAIEENVDLIVSHHPMIFKSIKKVSDQDITGEKILDLAENKIACYAMHTNFDVIGGMASLAADKINLINAKPLEITCDTQEGIGRIGELKESKTLKEIGDFVKAKFNLESVFIYGNLDSKIKRVAISPGSGKSEIENAIREGAELLITGDIGHHEGIDAIDMGLCIIDATHYGLEYIFIDYVKEYISSRVGEDVEIITYSPGCPLKVI